MKNKDDELIRRGADGGASDSSTDPRPIPFTTSSLSYSDLMEEQKRRINSDEKNTLRQRSKQAKTIPQGPPFPLPDAAAVFEDFEKNPRKPIITPIAITQNDDPWANDLDDRLGANDEAKAFARLAVAKDFTPPLAIGLFGNWGSGKSFFMRLIYQHIERLIQGEPSAQAPEAGSKAFHTDVVQIRFNAWHYAETNLWASLVSHLFIELDRWYTKHNPGARDPLLEHLSTSRMLTLDAAKELVRRRRDQRAAAEQLLKARKELEDAHAKAVSSPSTYLKTLNQIFAAENQDKEVQTAKEDMTNAVKSLGIDTLAVNVKDFQEVSNALRSEIGKAKLLASGYKSQLLNWWSVGAFIGLMLALPWIATGLTVLKNQLPSLGGLHEDLILLSVVVTAVTARLRCVWGKVRGALEKLESGKKVLDDVINSQLAKEQGTFEVASQELARMNASVDEAKALVQVTSEQLAHATHDFSQGTGAGRLKKFVRARATDGEYAQHLGLIATVRKDFEELAFNVAETGSLRESVEAEREAFVAKMEKFLEANSELLDEGDIAKLRAAATQPPTEVRSFKRIALYIDDLDRCPPDKVVEVLQAVHLLLTFPLFVVMVAVDVRWVRQALLEHYPNLMAANEEQPQTASVSDYLEKIFQIPYWMRPMDSASSEQFLQSQLERIKSAGSVEGVVPVLDEHSAVEVVNVEGTTPEPMRLTEGETQAMQKLARFMGASPRRALRFLNVYRLIKVSLKPDDLKVLEDGEYKALLTLLAIAMATPRCFSNLLHSVNERSDSFEMKAIKTLITAKQYEDSLAEYKRLEEILKIYDDLVLKQRVGASHRVKNYTAIIQRYSFDG
ncbi:KAP family NTPase [Pseudomonas monsensis]|uniref:KAP family NTPase n=1 Tax=Pseudomonas monsensis TaxID=2745509 RepID=A0ABT3YNG6_9PSED|nr:P-loop NTPase fold protein [Pseudomonas monsensis]MCY0107029.1 KAP family NTPase [Pseudomonas monsensis]